MSLWKLSLQHPCQHQRPPLCPSLPRATAKAAKAEGHRAAEVKHSPLGPHVVVPDLPRLPRLDALHVRRLLLQMPRTKPERHSPGRSHSHARSSSRQRRGDPLVWELLQEHSSHSSSNNSSSSNRISLFAERCAADPVSPCLLSTSQRSHLA